MVGFFSRVKFSLIFFYFEREKQQHISNCQNCESKKYFRSFQLKFSLVSAENFPTPPKKLSLPQKHNCKCKLLHSANCSNVRKEKKQMEFATSTLPQFRGKKRDKKAKIQTHIIATEHFSRCIIFLLHLLGSPIRMAPL